jgi:hypothetical protein
MHLTLEHRFLIGVKLKLSENRCARTWRTWPHRSGVDARPRSGSGRHRGSCAVPCRGVPEAQGLKRPKAQAVRYERTR